MAAFCYSRVIVEPVSNRPTTRVELVRPKGLQSRMIRLAKRRDVWGPLLTLT